MTAARAAVHVVNIKPSTFNYHLFLYGGSAVGKRHHRRRPPLAKAVCSAAFIHGKRLVLGAKQPVLAAFQPPMSIVLLICKRPKFPIFRPFLHEYKKMGLSLF